MRPACLSPLAVAPRPAPLRAGLFVRGQGKRADAAIALTELSSGLTLFLTFAACGAGNIVAALPVDPGKMWRPHR